MNEENINLGEIFAILKKGYKIILISVIAAVAVAGIFSFFVIKPKYEAKVKLFIGKEDTKGSTGYDNSEIQMYQKLITTYAEIIKTEDLIGKATGENKVSLVDETPKTILNSLVVTPRNDTQILEIVYKGNDPQRTVDIVQAITTEFINSSKALIKNGNVQIIEEAKLPVNPVSPNKKMNILISLVLGVMIGVGIVLLKEFLDNTFKNKDDLEKVLGVPVLGIIPEYDLNEVKSHYRVGGRKDRSALKSKNIEKTV
ncbi:MAG: YveK family protein [Clostridium sp.]